MIETKKQRNHVIQTGNEVFVREWGDQQCRTPPTCQVTPKEQSCYCQSTGENHSSPLDISVAKKGFWQGIITTITY